VGGGGAGVGRVVERGRAAGAPARTDATTVRLDLQEALMRLDEANTMLQALSGERDALRGEAGPLRDWATKVVAEHAYQQGELERLRTMVEAFEARLKGVDQMQRELEELRARGSSSRRVDTVGGGGESLSSGKSPFDSSRLRDLAGLLRALEPFMWGLQQATAFYTKANVGGAEAHLKVLQQLQGVLLRLRDEIAKLDLG
jgi:hypothetical protein